MTKFDLIIPITQIDILKESCETMMLVPVFGSTTGKNVHVSISRKNNAQIHTTTIFDLGRIFETNYSRE